MNRKLIEYNLSLAEISEASVREKNAHIGSPAKFHVWWARTAFAALIDDPGPDDPARREYLEDLIERITPWEAVKDGDSEIVRISSNEWKKARHFGQDFWLYIVTGAKTETPELHRIQNPAAQFQVGAGIEVTGYIIQEDAWRHKVTADL